MREAAHDAAIVDSALARCDLTHLAARPASSLSGGEQKRVAIARALAQEPKVLLLDEPGAFLDVRHQLDLHDLLVSEVKERRLGCLVVMHDLNLAAQYADRVVLMKGGRIIAAGPAADVMTRAKLREAFDGGSRVVVVDALDSIETQSLAARDQSLEVLRRSGEVTLIVSASDAAFAERALVDAGRSAITVLSVSGPPAASVLSRSSRSSRSDDAASSTSPFDEVFS